MFRSLRRKSCLKLFLVVLILVIMYYSSSSFLEMIYARDTITFNRILFGKTLDIVSLPCQESKIADRKGQARLMSHKGWRKENSYINMYEWTSDDFCLSSMRDVLWNPLFPRYPTKVRKLSLIDENTSITGTAFRRFNFFLRPRISGDYFLSFNLKGGIDLRIFEYRIELGQSHRISKTCFHASVDSLDNVSSYTTKGLFFNVKSVYLFDIIHWMVSDGRLSMRWRSPDRSYFIPINSELLSAFNTFNDSRGLNLTSYLRSDILPASASNLETDRRTFARRDPRRQFHRIEQTNARDLFHHIASCHYQPSYLSNGTVKLYTGYLMIKEGRYYPDFHILPSDIENSTLDESTVLSVSNEIDRLLSQSSHGNYRSYKTEQVVFMEENKEKSFGHRYFVQLDLKEKQSNRTIRLTDYFYKANQSSPLCLPSAFDWKKDVQVNIIFTTSSNQKKWVLLTLDAIAKIGDLTKDTRIHVIVADFNTLDIDFDREFKARGLNYTIVSLPGKFNKVKGINRAVNTILDPGSIVFTIDLHLEFPLFILDEVRKNTIRNKTVYAPVLVRLPCGKHIEYTDRRGAYWVANGFGVLSMYKEDWDIIGGMDEKRYGEKWGGEDWEIIDRVISKRYEVIQRRLPGYYHIYHSRKGSSWYN